MHDANEASRRLFGLDSLTASAEHLPIRSGSVRHAWALGVLSTADDPRAALREAARVLEPDGRLGLLVYLRAARHLDDEPTRHALPGRGPAGGCTSPPSGSTSWTTIPMASVDDPPPGWTDRATAADEWIEEHHRDEDAWVKAHESETAIGRLLRDEPRRRPTPRGPPGTHRERTRADRNPTSALVRSGDRRNRALIVDKWNPNGRSEWRGHRRR